MENKSGPGLSATAAVWQGPGVGGLMGSRGREEWLPAQLERRGEVETLKNEWKNFATS